MFYVKREILCNIRKKKYNITNTHRDKIEEFIDKYQEDDTKVMLDLIERTELMLLNNS